LLLKERMRAMAASSPSPSSLKEGSDSRKEAAGRKRLAYCYVSPGNEKSRALMKSVGMEMSEWCVSWAVVKVPEAAAQGQ
jgi:hypothetical protein